MNQLPEKGTLIGDKYEVLRILGQGGMGAVYEASHRLTGKHFAIKWMLPDLSGSEDAVRRFIREAQVAGRVEHQNVVEVYDLGQQDGSFYMVMELLQGQSLQEHFQDKSRLGATEAAQIMIPVLRGVAAAHKAGIIHRDLKPENIYLSQSPDDGPIVPKVLDFGISKMPKRQGDVTAALTRIGEVMGTPHYMSSEQLRAKTIDHRTDIYALGVILYQILCGELPFPGPGYGDLVLQIATSTPTPLSQRAPDLPNELFAVVSRAMAREASDRYQTVVDFATALEPFADGTCFSTGANSIASAAPDPHSTQILPVVTSQTPMATTTTARSRTNEGAPRGLIYAVVGMAAAVALLALGFQLTREEEDWATEESTPTSTAPPAAPLTQSPASPTAAKPTNGLVQLDLNGSVPHKPPVPAQPTAPTRAVYPTGQTAPDQAGQTGDLPRPLANNRERWLERKRLKKQAELRAERQALRRRRRPAVDPSPAPQSPSQAAPATPTSPTKSNRSTVKLTSDDF